MTTTTISTMELIGCRCGAFIQLASEHELVFPNGKVQYACDDCFKKQKWAAEVQFRECINRMEIWCGKGTMSQVRRNRMRDIYRARFGVLSAMHPRYDKVMAAANVVNVRDKKGI